MATAQEAADPGRKLCHAARGRRDGRSDDGGEQKGRRVQVLKFTHRVSLVPNAVVRNRFEVPSAKVK